MGLELDLLFFMLLSASATLILTKASILNRVRPKHQFFHCPMCVGFWVGLFWCIAGAFEQVGLIGELMTSLHPLGFVGLACVGSLVSYWAGVVIDDDGIRLKYRKGDSWDE
jgi:hypothetical protein